jgi:lysophospholipase L1-like esterase
MGWRGLRWGGAALGLGALFWLTNHYTLQGRPALADPIGWLPFVAVAMACGLALRSSWKQVGFALIPVLLLVLVIEAGLRVYFWSAASPEEKALLATPSLREGDAQIVYTPHHYSLYAPEPGVARPDGLRHNASGLRDDRELAPDPEALRIVFIGGSTTYTVRIRDNAKIFSTGLEALLSEQLGAQAEGLHVEVVNAGMSGATSAENLIRLAFVVSELRPDLVVIQHGINDSAPRQIGALQSDYGNYRKRWSAPSPFAEHSIAHAMTISLLRSTMLGSAFVNHTGIGERHHLYAYTNRRDSAAQKPGAGADNDVQNDARYFVRNTRYMISLCRAMGARVLLATAPIAESAGASYELTQEHNEITRTIAGEEGVDFFDFAALMKHDSSHMPDGVHVSQEGSDLKRDLYHAYFQRSGLFASLVAEKQETLYARP